jgi:hypothetical protein
VREKRRLKPDAVPTEFSFVETKVPRRKPVEIAISAAYCESAG